MTNFLGSVGLILIVGGLLFVVANMGIPYTFSGNISGIKSGLAAVSVGFLLIAAHAVLLLRQNGWAASGFTLPSLATFGVGLAVSGWFLFGPRANAYPGIYGLGILLFSVFVAFTLVPMFTGRQGDRSNDASNPVSSSPEMDDQKFDKR